MRYHASRTLSYIAQLVHIIHDGIPSEISAAAALQPAVQTFRKCAPQVLLMLPRVLRLADVPQAYRVTPVGAAQLLRLSVDGSGPPSR
eukprot:366126-Chlamydomonas_euryale.AAC.6